mgnify:FL=1
MNAVHQDTIKFLAFRFTTDAGCLAGLNGRVWTVDQVDFVTDYFPHVPLHP